MKSTYSHSVANYHAHSILSSDSFVKNLLLILGSALILAIASQIAVPFKPVPLTFQSVTVVLLGMTLGSKKGALAVGTYLLAGVLGLPVYANLSNAYVPGLEFTVGYLIGFLPAAFVSGYLVEHGFAKNFISSFIAACLSVSIIFIAGVTVLATLIGWKSAIQFGLMPFIYTEVIKLAALALVVPRFWRTGCDAH